MHLYEEHNLPARMSGTFRDSSGSNGGSGSEPEPWREGTQEVVAAKCWSVEWVGLIDKPL